MRSACCFVAALGAASLAAQSPLTTLYLGNGAVAPGGQLLFDLTVRTDLTITRLDVNCSDTVGSVGSLEVYTTPNTWVGNEGNAGAWTLVGGSGLVSAGPNQPTPVCLSAGIPLAIGGHGVAVRHRGVTILRTNGNGSNQVYSTAELTLTAGATQTVPWSTTFQPRVWNGAIHYLPGTVAGPFVCAASVTYGVGCGGMALTVIGQPRLGSAVTMQTTGVPLGSLLNVRVLSLTRHDPGFSLQSLGAPGCFQSVGLDDTFASTGSGTWSVPVPIPPTAILLGLDVFGQTATFVPGINALGVVTANGIGLYLGNA